MSDNVVHTSEKGIQSALSVRHGKVRLSVPDAACIRIEVDEQALFEDRPSWFAVNRSGGPVAEARIIEHPERLEVLTPYLRLILQRGDGVDLAGRLYADILQSGKVFSRWHFGDFNRENFGGSICTLDRLDGPAELEEGLFSAAGWYLYDDSASPLQEGDRFVPRRSGTRDYYLFGYGRAYQRALQSLMRVAGPVPLPRRRAMGLWFSRYWPFTQGDYEEIAREFADQGVPLDYLVFDMDWHRRDGTEAALASKPPGWTGWSWNKELIPDPASLLKKLNQERIAVALNSHPHDAIRPHEDCYTDFMNRLKGTSVLGKTVPLDAGCPEYMQAFFESAHIPHEEMGVDLWWVDWQQSAEMPVTRSVPSLPNLSALNYHYFQHSERNRKRGTILSRWAGWGDHRHPMHFSGDAFISWDMLKFQVELTVSSGNQGCFFWSHDIGGFRGKDDVDDASGRFAKGKRHPELYLRWLQFGAFSAAVRLHSGLVESLDKRPWLWGGEVLQAFRAMYHLRRRLMPYIYSAAYQCSAEALPLLRPLYLQHPHEEEAFRHPGQYYFGDHIMVCPVVTPVDSEGWTDPQVVWLPPGCWMHYFTGQVFRGPCTLHLRSRLQEFPLFFRCNTVLPVIEHVLPFGMTHYHPADVSLWACLEEGGDDRISHWYHDDGESMDYRHGAFLLCHMQMQVQDGIYSLVMGNRNPSPSRILMPDNLSLRLECPERLSLESCEGAVAQVGQKEGNTLNLRLSIMPETTDQALCVTMRAAAIQTKEIST